MRYSPERKETVLRKMMPPRNRSIKKLSQEEGISEATLFNWRKEAREKGLLLPDGDSGPEGWSARDKFAAVLETAAFNETDLAEYCRKRGIYPEQLLQWRRACESARAKVEAHLSDCDTCREEIIIGNGLVRGPKHMVSKDLMRLKKSFKEIDAEIEIEKTGENNPCLRVRLPCNPKGVRVTLMQDDREREISSQLLNDAGAVFEEIPFGHYCLMFTRDGQKLGIYRFMTKETGYAGR